MARASIDRSERSARTAVAGLALVGALVAGCNDVAPRSFEDFMEDAFAREGVLARCNVDRDATAEDVECTNARRAAIVVAAEAERGRSQALSLESERKLEMLRDRTARAEQAEREAALAVAAAAEAAYEAQWRDPTRPASAKAQAEPLAAAPGNAEPVVTAPENAEPPTEIFEASVAATRRRPTIDLGATQPPASEIEIERPSLELAEATSIPRPFRNPD